MGHSDRYMHKDLVTVTIEKALFEIGAPAYEAIVLALKDTYNCAIPDCYEHPEYLKSVLEKHFGAASDAVIKTINENLDKSAKNSTIDKFLLVLNQ